MSLPACPVCQHRNKVGADRCASCGADLTDPDVLAMAGGAAPPAPAGEVGQLAARRFLRMSREGFASGRALRWLALIGGLLLVIAFLLPIERAPDWEGGAYVMSWDVLGKGGPTLALLIPLLAGVAGVALAVVPGLPGWLRGVLLTAFGVFGFAFALGPLGEAAGTPTRVATLLHLGILTAAVGAAARVLEPRSRVARYVLIAGAVITVVGYLIPVGRLDHTLPAEFSMWHESLHLKLTDAAPLTGLWGGLDRRVPLLLFPALFGLLPLVLMPVLAALAWRQPGEVWDRGGIALRPLSWLSALYVPAAYGLYVFNYAGWPGEEASDVMLSRVRLTSIAAAFTLWIEMGVLAPLLHFEPRPAAPTT